MSALDDLDREMWLARRLGDFGAIFAGTTDRAIRQARTREAILELNLEHAICGRGPGGKPETFAEVYQRLFGAPLRERA